MMRLRVEFYQNNAVLKKQLVLVPAHIQTVKELTTYLLLKHLQNADQKTTQENGHIEQLAPRLSLDHFILDPSDPIDVVAHDECIRVELNTSPFISTASARTNGTFNTFDSLLSPPKTRERPQCVPQTQTKPKGHFPIETSTPTPSPHTHPKRPREANRPTPPLSQKLLKHAKTSHSLGVTVPPGPPLVVELCSSPCKTSTDTSSENAQSSSCTASSDSDASESVSSASSTASSSSSSSSSFSAYSRAASSSRVLPKQSASAAPHASTISSSAFPNCSSTEQRPTTSLPPLTTRTTRTTHTSQDPVEDCGYLSVTDSGSDDTSESQDQKNAKISSTSLKQTSTTPVPPQDHQGQAPSATPNGAPKLQHPEPSNQMLSLSEEDLVAGAAAGSIITAPILREDLKPGNIILYQVASLSGFCPAISAFKVKCINTLPLMARAHGSFCTFFQAGQITAVDAHNNVPLELDGAAADMDDVSYGEDVGLMLSVRRFTEPIPTVESVALADLINVSLIAKDIMSLTSVLTQKSETQPSPPPNAASQSHLGITDDTTVSTQFPSMRACSTRTLHHPILGKLEIAEHLKGEEVEQLIDAKLKAVRASLRRQVDYYFSDQNYFQDKYLRANEDASGWIPLTLVASFHRMRSFTTNREYIAACLQGGLTHVELSECGQKLRKKLTRRLDRNSLHLASCGSASQHPAPSTSTTQDSTPIGQGIFCYSENHRPSKEAFLQGASELCTPPTAQPNAHCSATSNGAPQESLSPRAPESDTVTQSEHHRSVASQRRRRQRRRASCS